MPRPIIVTGMYRSGTSLITSLVQQWGAYVGRPDDLFGDRYGYLEHLGLQKLNDELLEGRERVPPHAELLVEKASEPAIRARARDLIRTMDEQAAGYKAWAWKDPRLPMVLPFWANIWGDVVYVITVRHPLETVLSGAEMEGVGAEDLPFSAGFAYWQYCMLNVLTFTQNSRRKIFMAYDQLIRNPLQESTRLCRFLDEQCGNDPAGAEERIKTMVAQISASRHHHVAPKSLAELSQTTREQRALYDFLRVKTIHPDETFNPDDFAPYPGWREYLQVMDMLLAVAGTPQPQAGAEGTC